MLREDCKPVIVVAVLGGRSRLLDEVVLFVAVPAEQMVDRIGLALAVHGPLQITDDRFPGLLVGSLCF